jgi:hypothetical protein
MSQASHDFVGATSAIHERAPGGRERGCIAGIPESLMVDASIAINIRQARVIDLCE